MTGGTEAISLSTIVKLAILGVVLIGAVLSTRSFCRVLCPVGAILAPLNFISLWRIPVPAQNCLSCGKCNRVCTQDSEPMSRLSKGVSANRALDCVVCYECKTTCPASTETRKGTTGRDIVPPLVPQ
jgi:polyferredoxin